MIEPEFVKELQRVLDVFGELPPSHVKELRRAYMKIDRRLWAQMTSHVIDNSQFVPRPAKFTAAYEALRRSWKTDKAEDQVGCEMCEKGFQEVYLVCNDFPYTALQPCDCNPFYLNDSYNRAKIERYISRDQYDAMVARIMPGPVPELPPARERRQAPPVQEKTAEEKPGPRPMADSMPDLPEDLTWK